MKPLSIPIASCETNRAHSRRLLGTLVGANHHNGAFKLAILLHHPFPWVFQAMFGRGFAVNHSSSYWLIDPSQELQRHCILGDV